MLGNKKRVCFEGLENFGNSQQHNNKITTQQQILRMNLNLFGAIIVCLHMYDLQILPASLEPY